MDMLGAVTFHGKTYTNVFPFVSRSNGLITRLFKLPARLKDLVARGGGGTWVFFGWVYAARDSKLAPRSKKNSPKIDTPF